MKKQQILERFRIEHSDLKTFEPWVSKMTKKIVNCYLSGHKVMVCGNGGSSADSDHIVGELMKGFDLKRPLNESLKKRIEQTGATFADKLQWGLPAISLCQHQALSYAIQNDIDASLVFAQQLIGYGNSGDILIGISTSGHAENVINAIQVAHALGISTIALSGKDGGKLCQIAQESFVAPANETYRIQEYHLAIYHVICLLVEEVLFGEEGLYYETCC